MLALPSPWVVVYHVEVVLAFVLNTTLLTKQCKACHSLYVVNLQINPHVAVEDKVVTILLCPCWA